MWYKGLDTLEKSSVHKGDAYEYMIHDSHG